MRIALDRSRRSLVVVGAGLDRPGHWGSSAARASWSTTLLGRDRGRPVVAGVVVGWTRASGPAPGLSQAAQVASARPAVTSLPWRTSGSRSRRVSASSRSTIPPSSRLR